MKKTLFSLAVLLFTTGAYANSPLSISETAQYIEKFQKMDVSQVSKLYKTQYPDFIFTTLSEETTNATMDVKSFVPKAQNMPPAEQAQLIHQVAQYIGTYGRKVALPQIDEGREFTITTHFLACENANYTSLFKPGVTCAVVLWVDSVQLGNYNEPAALLLSGQIKFQVDFIDGEMVALSHISQG